MTRIQQVLFALDGDYRGHPYYVTGSALVQAITSGSESLQGRSLAASHGVFTPGAYGVFPEEHSKSAPNPSLGSTLPSVTAYEDLFLFRDPAHPWMLDSRPGAATNTHDIRIQGGEPTFAPQTTFGTGDSDRRHRRSVRWHVHAHLHSDDPSVLPLDPTALEDLSVGGARNYGYGRLEYVDSQLVDLEELDYSWLEEAEWYSVDLVSPFVLESEYPGVGVQSLPWWWDVDADEVRTRETVLVERGQSYRLGTVDHGQLFEYTGSTPVQTAKNGITGIGLHSKYGFGELRVTPM